MTRTTVHMISRVLMLNMGWAHILILDNIPSRKCRLVKSISKFTMELLTNYSLFRNRVIWIVNVCLVIVNVQAFTNKLPMMEIAKDLNTKNGKFIKSWAAHIHIATHQSSFSYQLWTTTTKQYSKYIIFVWQSQQQFNSCFE